MEQWEDSAAANKLSHKFLHLSMRFQEVYFNKRAELHFWKDLSSIEMKGGVAKALKSNKAEFGSAGIKQGHDS
ncbi:hypothetical protein GLAREA_08807 [Glarea lozoyensis ATCC 20868]|uniref:Uncharacterized protein n=1 Tax=Glarea lozoyensis (strain ATCC 20868 / MF5171) TaxID=1116229 RepID=S3DHM0_GLAL2|nr:uncharacterized protein GLAREA_08807 [Glarea lozoyensis ATCC 20868]EPE36644.1 hypothetical protein GLAREA_08807 [Glarea lozoyensis ATCC 20868]